jgi:hypothetical protein
LLVSSKKQAGYLLTKRIRFQIINKYYCNLIEYARARAALFARILFYDILSSLFFFLDKIEMKPKQQNSAASLFPVEFD